jgi:hypothetical protein
VATVLPVQAAIIFQDNFDSENGGQGVFNYSDFQNFDVSDGSVDLLGENYFDFYPGNGLYVDLDGSTGDAALFSSKTSFNLNPGKYTLKFSLGSYSQFYLNDVNNVTVSLGNVFNEVIKIEPGFPLTAFSYTFDVFSATSGKLSFQNDGDDFYGALLDNIELSDTTVTQPVPEPTTILGTLVFGGLGGGSWLKRRKKAK